jgi:hypothetical protein
MTAAFVLVVLQVTAAAQIGFVTKTFHGWQPVGVFATQAECEEAWKRLAVAGQTKPSSDAVRHECLPTGARP